MRSHRLVGVLATIATLSLAIASNAVAGQLVYLHGGDLWTMPDTGGAGHVLATASEVGGTIGAGSFQSYTGVSVQPNGTDIVFDASVPDKTVAGDCTGECPGLYTLINGKVNRLSPAPYRCGNGGSVQCGGEEADPAVTTNGQVVYVAESAVLVGTCDYVLCGPTAGTSSGIYYRAIDGSGGATAWPIPGSPAPASADPGPGFGGIYGGAIASDPLDPTKIAYSGIFVSGLSFGQMCGAGGDSDCYPIDIDDSSGTYNQPSVDDSLDYPGLSFSSDGSMIADTETGNNPGIWVYPTGQSWTTTNPAPKYYWALEDDGTNEETGGLIGDVAFAGTGTNAKVVFSALNNLYSIPASCWSTPVNQSSPSPACGTFNAADPTSNPKITQLTTDGTASAPDTDPAWTSSAATITPLTNPNNNNNPPPPPGTTFKLKLTAPSSQKVLRQKGIVATVSCNVICAYAAGAGVAIKGSKSPVKAKGASGQLAANGVKKVTLKLSGAALKKIEKALKKHKQVTAVITAAGKDEAGKQVAVSDHFTVRH